MPAHQTARPRLSLGAWRPGDIAMPMPACVAVGPVLASHNEPPYQTA